MNTGLDQFDVLSFDCYGTLIDWETGIWDALQPLLEHNGCERVTRDVALQAFAAQESAQQSETPGMLYPAVLERVHVRLASQLTLDTTAALTERFGQSVPHWPAFPDSADALRILKRHFKLVILSNVNRGGFAASREKLGVVFDAVYTAEEIGSYKPSARNFQYMIDRLKTEHGIEPKRILHTAQSLFHDHVPASKAGLVRAWIDRQGLDKGGNWGATAPVAKRPQVTFVFSSLAEMAAALA